MCAIIGEGKDVIEIKNEYRLNLKNKSVDLLRMQSHFFNMKPKRVQYKPKSKELVFSYQSLDDSLNVDFVSIPSQPAIYYYCNSSSKNSLFKIENIFLFKNRFSEYKINLEHKTLTKAESREESINKYKNINYKLKLIEEEPAVELNFVNNP